MYGLHPGALPALDGQKALPALMSVFEWLPCKPPIRATGTLEIERTLESNKHSMMCAFYQSIVASKVRRPGHMMGKRFEAVCGVEDMWGAQRRCWGGASAPS